MPFEKSYDLPTVAGPTCVHLRSKAMYVTGQRQPSEPQQGSSSHCWCNLTQHVMGPDSSAVDTGRCVPGRECFRDTY